MPGAVIRLLGVAALCVAVAGCGTSAVETAEAPDTPLRGYRAVVVTVPLAAGQKQGLNVEIDLRQQETGGFKEFTNTSTATVSLSDIATGQRLGGISISASGASMEITAKEIGEQTAAWLVDLP